MKILSLEDAEAHILNLETSLLAVTDQIGKLMDLALQKDFVPAFVCSHSGLLLPGEYVRDWGRNGIGIGLGPDPVSDVLDSDYDTPPPALTPDIRRIEQIMHPVGPCMGQIDLQMVHPSVFEARAAIMDRDDDLMERRAGVVRAKQMKNPRGRLAIMERAYQLRKGVA